MSASHVLVATWRATCSELKAIHGTRRPRGHAYACDAEGGGHSLTMAGRQTDDLTVALAQRRLAAVDLSGEAVPPREWEGEARLRQIPA